ncbi:hypothetical protein, partial [Pseudomonas fluorescens]|uniref:hypothetical protein n=1 Tax=Pseudomonas fluorescens TaxID=294 RepID=UPI002B1E0FC0
IEAYMNSGFDKVSSRSKVIENTISIGTLHRVLSFVGGIVVSFIVYSIESIWRNQVRRSR